MVQKSTKTGRKARPEVRFRFKLPGRVGKESKAGQNVIAVPAEEELLKESRDQMLESHLVVGIDERQKDEENTAAKESRSNRVTLGGSKIRKKVVKACDQLFHPRTSRSDSFKAAGRIRVNADKDSVETILKNIEEPEVEGESTTSSKSTQIASNVTKANKHKDVTALYGYIQIPTKVNLTSLEIEESGIKEDPNDVQTSETQRDLENPECGVQEDLNVARTPETQRDDQLAASIHGSQSMEPSQNQSMIADETPKEEPSNSSVSLLRFLFDIIGSKKSDSEDCLPTAEEKQSDQANLEKEEANDSFPFPVNCYSDGWVLAKVSITPLFGFASQEIGKCAIVSMSPEKTYRAFENSATYQHQKFQKTILETLPEECNRSTKEPEDPENDGLGANIDSTSKALTDAAEAGRSFLSEVASILSTTKANPEYEPFMEEDTEDRPNETQSRPTIDVDTANETNSPLGILHRIGDALYVSPLSHFSYSEENRKAALISDIRLHITEELAKKGNKRTENQGRGGLSLASSGLDFLDEDSRSKEKQSISQEQVERSPFDPLYGVQSVFGNVGDAVYDAFTKATDTEAGMFDLNSDQKFAPNESKASITGVDGETEQVKERVLDELCIVPC